MSKKKSIFEMPGHLAVKAMNKAKRTLKSANGNALNTTEELVSEGIIVAAQWQTVGSHVLKGGLTLAEGQQDIIFEALTELKKHVILSKKRFTKLIA